MLCSEASCADSVCIQNNVPRLRNDFIRRFQCPADEQQGCTKRALQELCVPLHNEVLPVNFGSSGLNTPCFSLTKREMVCMLVKFPRVVTMQGNDVPKAV